MSHSSARRNPTPAESVRLFGLGSIALAGLVGGPLATGYLVARNTAVLRLSHQRNLAIAFFIVASIGWFWIMYRVPHDVLSELAVHLPQLVVWWVFAALLLRRQHANHVSAGGSFRSTWVAIGIALFTAIALRVLLRLVIPGVL